MQENKNSLFKVLGGLFAFLTVLLVGFLVLQQKYDFIKDNDIIEILFIVKNYMVLVSLAVVGFVFASKRGIVLFLLYMAALIVIIVFTFLLPDSKWIF